MNMKEGCDMKEMTNQIIHLQQTKQTNSTNNNKTPKVLLEKENNIIYISCSKQTENVCVCVCV